MRAWDFVFSTLIFHVVSPVHGYVRGSHHNCGFSLCASVCKKKKEEEIISKKHVFGCFVPDNQRNLDHT